MIHNLKCFNLQYLEEPPHFKMLSLKELKDTVRAGDWMASIDLKDAYLHVAIARKHRKYLRFTLNGEHYQWRVLPFGVSIAPWLFTRLTAPIAGLLHRRGIRFHIYIDDCLILGQDRQQLRHQISSTLTLLANLGWLVNTEKSELSPSQTLQFIGATFLTREALVRVPEDRWHSIQTRIQQLLTGPCTLRTWQQGIGLLTSAQDITPRGRLALRPLQMWLNTHLRGEADTRLPLPEDLRPHLQWWTLPSNVSCGVSLGPFRPTHHLFTDASNSGWGAHMNSLTASGRWSSEEGEAHINCLELLAVIRALEHWTPELRGARVMIATDNTTVAAHINKGGGTHSRNLLALTRDLFQLVDSIHMEVRARHIPGVTNVIADALSRPNGPTPTEWKLHPECFRWVCSRLGTPTIDLFATRFNHQLPVYVSPIPDPAALGVDALSMDWTAFDAYAFPPTALIQKVIQKACQENCRLLLIAPRWPSRHWYPELAALAHRDPLPLPPWPNLLIHPMTKQRHPNPSMFQLHAWVLSPGV